MTAGILFHRAIDRALAYLETLGYWAAGVIGVVLLLVVLAKWWQRRRVRKLLELARISVDELKRLLTISRRDDTMSLFLQEHSQEFSHRLLVIDNQYLAHHTPCVRQPERASSGACLR